ncbi:MAG: ATP-binding protein, partial [Alphaproteobacteria bacterium]|nr:ATP-binding protein [Alphaproteobacteria bacterium]
GCIELVRDRARQGEVALDIDLQHELPPIEADQRKFKQILINLLSNAVKFTQSGGQVVASAAIAPGGEFTLRVKDTGIGMRAEDIPVALTPFRQVDSRLARAYEGTGLGLPLVKSLTELHGGAVSIESAPGVGTTVTVTLPPTRVRTGAGSALPEPLSA